jgi:serine/threonine protein kinase
MLNSLYGLIFCFATLGLLLSGTKTFSYQICKAMPHFTPDEFLPYALENNWEDITENIGQDKTSHTRCYFDLEDPAMNIRKVSSQVYFYSSVQRGLDNPRRGCWIKLIDREKLDRNTIFILKRTKSVLDYLGSLSAGPSNLAIEYWDFFQFDQTKVFISYPLYEPVTFRLLRKLAIDTNETLESLKIRLIKNILTGLNFLHTNKLTFRDLK